MRSEILSVGTELLMGQIANTDAQYLSRKLSQMGITVYRHSVVGDNPDRLREAVEDYREETGDEKVLLFKFIPINVMTEGFGAAGHPSLKTHLRMGKELAHLLRPYLC